MISHNLTIFTLLAIISMFALSAFTMVIEEKEIVGTIKEIKGNEIILISGENITSNLPYFPRVGKNYTFYLIRRIFWDKLMLFAFW